MPKRKSDMSIKIDKLTSVYEHEIFRLSDEYISFNNLDDDMSIRGKFRDMINYISDRITIEKDCKDIDYYIDLFKVLLRLCDKYNYNPTKGLFHSLIGISVKEIESNIGKDRTSKLLEYIYISCSDRIIDSLSNQSGSNRNGQFIAAAVYGLTESNYTPKADRTRLSQQEIAAQIGVNLTENAENEAVKD